MLILCRRECCQRMHNGRILRTRDCCPFSYKKRQQAANEKKSHNKKTKPESQLQTIQKLFHLLLCLSSVRTLCEISEADIYPHIYARIRSFLQTMPTR